MTEHMSHYEIAVGLTVPDNNQSCSASLLTDYNLVVQFTAWNTRYHSPKYIRQQERAITVVEAESWSFVLQY